MSVYVFGNEWSDIRFANFMDRSCDRREVTVNHRLGILAKYSAFDKDGAVIHSLEVDLD